MPRDREERIAVFDIGPRFTQQLDDLIRWRLAIVVDVRFVRETEDTDPRALQSLALLVERKHGLVHHVLRHTGVDFSRKLDEPRPRPVLCCLPREVERVERDAVSAEPWAGVERHEPEWLRLRRFDHFPHVDVHAVEDRLELVHQRNVHGSEHVLEKLARFGNARARDWNHALQRAAVECCSRLRGRLIHAADYLRYGPRGEPFITGIFPLRRKGQEKVLRTAQTTAFEDRTNLLIRRSRIRGRPEYHELAATEPHSDLARSRVNERIIRLAMLPERRWNTNDDCVALRQPIEVRRRAVPAALHCFRDTRRSDVLDERLAARDRSNLHRIDVESCNPEPALLKDEGQRKANVALPDDPHASSLLSDSIEECVRQGNLFVRSEASVSVRSSMRRNEA